MEIESQIKKDLAVLEASFQELADNIESERETIDEEVWKERWMRGIMEDPNFPLAAWVNSVALTSGTPVDILRNGVVVATMPPVVAAKGAQRIKYSSITSTNTISKQVVKDSEMFPQHGQQRLFDALADTITGEYDSAWMDTWEHLRATYGYSNTPAIDASAPAAPLAAPDDTFEVL